MRDVFRIRFGVLPDGNAPFDPQNEFVHKNLLYTARGIDEVMSATAKSREEVEARARSQRGPSCWSAVRRVRGRIWTTKS